MNKTDHSICKTKIVHKDIVKNVLNSFPDDNVLSTLTELFKVLGDKSRIKILYALLTSEMCVCDLSAILNSSQSAISHQLRILRQFSLVKFRKEGKVVFYSLKDDQIKTIIDIGLEHINEKK